MKLFIFAVPAVAIGLLAAAPAFAADAFTLEIPVEFKNLNPAIKSVLIRCLLEGEDPATHKPHAFGKPKSLSLALTNGNYTGPTPVKIVYQTQDFAAADQPLLNSVATAQCNFDLVTATGTLNPANGATTNPVLEHKNGTPYETISHGTVPK